MPVAQSNQFPDALTPVCSKCNVFLCWDISLEEYKESPMFWEFWTCQDCNGGVKFNKEFWEQKLKDMLKRKDKLPAKIILLLEDELKGVVCDD